MWAAALEANKDRAIAFQSQQVCDRYIKYVTGCANLFREGYTDVDQFTWAKQFNADALAGSADERVAQPVPRSVGRVILLSGRPNLRSRMNP